MLDSFHAFTYGSAFWYATRAFARIYDPSMVARWFRNGKIHVDTDLELYNIRTDAFCLAALALFLPVLSAAASAKTQQYPSTSTSAAVKANWIATFTVFIAVLHHASTGWFAYLQDKDPSTTTGAMLLGWTVSLGMSLMGLAVIAWGSINVKVVETIKSKIK